MACQPKREDDSNGAESLMITNDLTELYLLWSLRQFGPSITHVYMNQTEPKSVVGKWSFSLSQPKRIIMSQAMTWKCTIKRKDLNPKKKMLEESLSKDIQFLKEFLETDQRTPFTGFSVLKRRTGCSRSSSWRQTHRATGKSFKDKQVAVSLTW